VPADELNENDHTHKSAAATAPSPSQKTEHAKLTKSAPTTADSEKERKGGLRGLLGKFGSRKSKDETKRSDPKSVSKSESVPYEEHKEAEKPVAGTTAAAAKASEIPRTEGVTNTGVPSTVLPPVETGPKFGEDHVDSTTGNAAAAAANKEPAAVEPDSPSSFKRNEVDPVDPDDVSSSGADEDDLQRGRGRGGRSIARKLGFGGSRTYKTDKQPGKLTPLKSAAADRQGSEDNETFEEARDKFDENLAPPPAFAGQAKSESPVRETRFQEQL